MPQVFISYSRRDLSFVKKLAAGLKNNGLDVWYDVSGISGGSRWREEIEKAIRNSQFVIVVLSPDSMKSEWVDREFIFASNLGLKIVPLMFRTCDLTLNFVNLNYIDVRDGKYRQEFPNLLSALAVDTSRLTPPAAVAGAGLITPGRLAFIGSAAIVIGALIILPSVSQFIFPKSEPAIVFTPTNAFPTPDIFSVTPEATSLRVIALPSATATNSPLPPTVTFTREPGFEIVEPQEVLNMAPSLRTLGQLALERYSAEDRNKINNTLTFTIESPPDVPILWRWFWCAVNDRVLEQNMTRISILFDADGYVIPEEQLAKVIFENADPTYEGWKCLTYETVLRNWKPGTYKLTQTMTISSAINDGRDKFEAGYKIYEYTVNISP